MTNDKVLTNKRQRDILTEIARTLDSQGYPPTIREIGIAVGISSTSVVNYHLNRLKDSGYIERDDRVSRGIKLTEKATGAGWSPVQGEAASSGDRRSRRSRDVVSRGVGDSANVVRLPMAGKIAAGLPVPVPDDPDPEDFIEVAAELAGSGDQVYALEVKGDSMIDALIHDGDIVVMERTQVAENGDMVAAWIVDREETTLKRFYHEGDRVRLQPANPTMDAFYHDPGNVEIQGRVVAVIRNLRRRPAIAAL